MMNSNYRAFGCVRNVIYRQLKRCIRIGKLLGGSLLYALLQRVLAMRWWRGRSWPGSYRLVQFSFVEVFFFNLLIFAFIELVEKFDDRFDAISFCIHLWIGSPYGFVCFSLHMLSMHSVIICDLLILYHLKASLKKTLSFVLHIYNLTKQICKVSF